MSFSDVLPWLRGCGFSGDEDWWDYLLRQDEAYRLDVLVTLAFMHESVRTQLLDDRDIFLLELFQFSPETTRWLAQVDATTITDLAQAVSLRQQSVAG